MTPHIQFTQQFDDTEAPVEIEWDIAYAPCGERFAIREMSVVKIVVMINGYPCELPRVQVLHVEGTTQKTIVDAFAQAEVKFGPLLDLESVQEKCADDWTGAGHVTWEEREVA